MTAARRLGIIKSGGNFSFSLTTPLPKFLTTQGRLAVLPIWAVTTVEFSVANSASLLSAVDEEEDEEEREETPAPTGPAPTILAIATGLDESLSDR